MKKLILIVLLNALSLISLNAEEAARKVPAKLQHEVEFILEKVLLKKNQPLRTDIAFPKIYYKSKTPLKQFQDAIEKQWGFRPDVITNAFAVANNEIYLMDDADYYSKKKRCMDDSLAHEFTHYVQVKYQNWDLNDESLEWEAVDVQTAFRNEFCKI
ncbi:MAG: hypothetical protein WC635_09585 [Bacteriovorax sp.]|jgi:hypothetical protein